MLKVGTLDGGRPTRIEQIVDVSHLDLDEDAVVEFSASFFYDGVDPCAMWLLTEAFTMDADEISGTTGKLNDPASSSARRGLLLPAELNEWRKRRVRMDLPAGTKTIVFSIVASQLPETSAGAARYIDGVEARMPQRKRRSFRTEADEVARPVTFFRQMQRSHGNSSQLRNSKRER